MIIKELLETVANYPPNNFCELKIVYNGAKSFISLEELESSFISWKNRTPKKLLRLMIIYEYNSTTSFFK